MLCISVTLRTPWLMHVEVGHSTICVYLQGVSPVGPVEVLQSERARGVLGCNEQVGPCHTLGVVYPVHPELKSVTDAFSGGTPLLDVQWRSPWAAGHDSPGGYTSHMWS